MTEQLDELRVVVERTPVAPEAMTAYLEKVRDCASTITDADVQALKDAGCSEDEIFEQTVGVAIAQGLRRLDAARDAL